MSIDNRASHGETFGGDSEPCTEDEPPQNRTTTATVNTTRMQWGDSPPCDELATSVAKGTRFPHGRRADAFRKRHFPSATLADWNNWHWQLQNTIRTADAVARFVNLTDDERDAMSGFTGGLPTSITPYYASLIDPANPAGAIRRTMIPTTAELVKSQGEAEDPLGEDNQSPIPGLIHRYPDRVLFLATEYCSAYCRYCTRSRMVGQPERKRYCCGQWEQAIAYIREHPAIRDVIVSGGDPLTLPDEPLEWLLMNLRAIPHVEVVRIGSKTPAVLPMRITGSLVKILRKANPLWMSLHFTHPDELTPETAEACNRLADAGLPLGSQTVLLKGVNDNVDTMRALMTGLMKIRVRPYYIYQCDPIVGSAHFRTPVATGLDIIKGLRGHVSGYAVPQYVIDSPGGGGKIPLLPDYLAGKDGNDLVLRNYQGKTYHYPDVAD